MSLTECQFFPLHQSALLLRNQLPCGDKITSTVLYFAREITSKRFQNLTISKKQTKVFELILLKTKNNFGHEKELKTVKKNDLLNLERNYFEVFHASKQSF